MDLILQELKCPQIPRQKSCLIGISTEAYIINVLTFLHRIEMCESCDIIFTATIVLFTDKPQ